MTLTLNPLMGHLSATYALRASPTAAFCSRFEFNMYSYESDVVLGCELWRPRSSPSSSGSSSAAVAAALAGGEGTLGLDAGVGVGTAGPRIGEWDRGPAVKDDFAGVLKAKVTQKKGIGLLWEGRLKHLLFSVGGSIDFRRKDQPVRQLGLEVQYSS